MNDRHNTVTRRSFLAAGAASVAAPAALRTGTLAAADAAAAAVVTPPTGKRILLSCKLGMIAKEVDGKKPLLSTTEIYVSRGRRHTLRDHGGQI